MDGEGVESKQKDSMEENNDNEELYDTYKTALKELERIGVVAREKARAPRGREESGISKNIKSFKGHYQTEIKFFDPEGKVEDWALGFRDRVTGVIYINASVMEESEYTLAHELFHHIAKRKFRDTSEIVDTLFDFILSRKEKMENYLAKLSIEEQTAYANYPKIVAEELLADMFAGRVLESVDGFENLKGESFAAIADRHGFDSETMNVISEALDLLVDAITVDKETSNTEFTRKPLEIDLERATRAYRAVSFDPEKRAK